MRTPVLALWLLGISSLGGCAGFADSSVEGVAPQQAMDISAALGAQKNAHHIYSCDRWPNGMIIVRTDVGDFSARRVGNRWEFSERVITGGG
jgi:hypothetical protein